MPDRILPITKTSSAAVAAQATEFYGAHLTAGSAAATATLYDNASAGSGTILATLAAAIGTGDAVQLPADKFIACANGIYATISGTGASLTVYSAG